MSTMASPGTTIAQRLAQPLSPFEAAMDALSRRLHVAQPGIVQSFNAAKQTVTVQLAVREIARVAGNPTAITTKVLADVPVMLPRGGGFTLTTPIIAGDECLVVFADVSVAAWFASGGVQNQFETTFRHDLSDGFAIMGCWNQQRVVENYSTQGAQFRSDDGTVTISVNSNNIIIDAPTVTVTAKNATVNASENATVAGQTVNVSGSESVTINGDRNTKIDGTLFLQHTHSGVSSGTGASGPVIG